MRSAQINKVSTTTELEIIMSRTGQITLTLVLACTAVASAAGYFAVWPTVVESSVSESRSRLSPLSYEEFRTRLVRGDFTPMLIESAGCTLIESEVLNREIDVSTDPRPLLNALKRKSKSTVKQTQSLTIELANNNLEASTLQLLQSAEICAKHFTITVTLQEPAGILDEYRYEIQGVPEGEGTRLTFRLDATVKKEISAIAHPWVPQKVQEGVQEALDRQSEAFVQAIHGDN